MDEQKRIPLLDMLATFAEMTKPHGGIHSIRRAVSACAEADGDLSDNACVHAREAPGAWGWKGLNNACCVEC